VAIVAGTLSCAPRSSDSQFKLHPARPGLVRRRGYSGPRGLRASGFSRGRFLAAAAGPSWQDSDSFPRFRRPLPPRVRRGSHESRGLVPPQSFTSCAGICNRLAVVYSSFFSLGSLGFSRFMSFILRSRPAPIRSGGPHEIATRNNGFLFSSSSRHGGLSASRQAPPGVSTRLHRNHLLPLVRSYYALVIDCTRLRPTAPVFGGLLIRNLRLLLGGCGPSSTEFRNCAS